MSLLLDARKKSQQANSAQAGNGSHSGTELSLEPHPDSASQPAASASSSSSDSNARAAGQNLFNAKSRVPSSAFAGNNRNLLIALGGMIVLLAAGAGYVWYAITPSNTQRAVVKPTIASPDRQTTAIIQPQNNLVPDVAPTDSPKPAAIHKPARVRTSVKVARAHTDNPVIIEQHYEEPIYPILNNAYLAYRNGNLDQAQQLYLRALHLDSSNSDALLGLAAIAQRRGEYKTAAHYYAQVMELDPRNAVANAGLSALTTDDNRESRLKTLLNEQQDSPSLHFALGNYYAEQSRWDEAQQAYFDAYKAESDNAELAFNLAVSLDRLGQGKQAAQYYQRALQLDPGYHADFDHATITQRIKELTH
jgi:tetratricopeptide (TPR) repeat protein